MAFFFHDQTKNHMEEHMEEESVMSPAPMEEHMEGDMMDSSSMEHHMGSGEMVMGLPAEVFWLLVSGLIFLGIALFLFLGPYRKQKDELTIAVVGYFGSMALFQIFGAFSMLWGNPLLMYLGSFAAVTGSTFVAKFPLSALSNKGLRQVLYLGTVASAWTLVAWMFISGLDPEASMRAAIIYMIILGGAISGTYMVWKGFHLKESETKVKCLGGGFSLWICCFGNHFLELLLGLTVIGTFIMISVPLALLVAILLAHMVAKRNLRPSKFS